MSTHEATSQQPLLQAIDLKKHYPVKKGMFAPERLVKALDGVSFNLERGKTLAVVGESGCGKSTLGRLLTMIETPTGGELYYQGQDLLKHDPQAQKLRDAPRDKCTLSCAINGIHAAFHYLKKNYISGCVMTVPTGW